MSQSKEEKSDSDNESSSDSKSDTSSDSESESGSSNSSSSDNDDNNNNSDDSQQQQQQQSSANDKSTTSAQSVAAPTNSNNTTKTEDNSSDDDDDDDEDEDDDDEDEDGEDEENDKNDVNDNDSNYSTRNHNNNHSADNNNYHSSKSSYDEEDYAANRRKNRVKREIKRKPAIAKPNNKKNTNRWNSETSESESEDSEDSSNLNQRMNARKAPVKNNRKKKTNYSSDSDSDDARKRSGNKRKTTASVSYKEASEDEKTGSEDLIDIDLEEEQATPIEETDKSETIERIVGKRIGKKGVTGNQTTVYEVEENGDPNEGAEKLDKKLIETQYLIKWKGWSHIHNTYESEQSLRDQKVKGLKKLENYIKREKDIENWRKFAGPEDIDYFECQQELHSELLKSYYNVERIIAQVQKSDGNGIDYLCKWESLPYSDATWEDSSLVQKNSPDKIKEFQDREQSKNTPSKHCKAMKYRPKFHQLKSQPEFLGLDRGLTLRDYQMDGLNWLILTWCKENSVILADEMGLGKTIQTICFLYTLFKNHSMYGPFLCVVPLSTMTAWQREFHIWAPEMNVVTYLGDVQSREIIRQYEWSTDDSSKHLKFNAILTTYEILLKDKTFLGCINWAALLVDEAHRLKNDDSLLYKALKDFETNHRLLITGTPLQNSLKELWALLHFIMPVKFETWDDFELNYGSTTDKGYTKLHRVLEPYILRRVKKDVEKSLPAKVEQILRVEMTSIQKQYYKWILTKNFSALRKGVKGSTTTFLNIVIELKKCCNHALLTRPNEYETQTNQEDVIQQLLKGSGKLVLLDKLLCRLRETGHRVLIFSQMVRMLDILAEYLQKRHFPFQRLDGSIKGELRKQALDHFNAENSQDFCFLLSTRAGGLGINLATADTVIIFDSDWNPQNDLQAQARAHRIGQKNQVNIYRLVTARSVEEEIVERAKQKMVLDHLVIQRMDTTGRTVLEKQNGPSNSTQFNKDELSAILKFGAEELFKDEEDGDDELVCDIDEILRRAETRDEQPAMVGDELLSAFKVARFAFEEDKVAASPSKNVHNNENGVDQDGKDWDSIIPANLRKAVEDEERNKEMEDLYLPPRRKTLQQINQSNDVNENHGRKRKKPADDDEEEEEEDGSAEGSEEDRPKKRGRPPVKEKLGNFNDNELRRFIRSYKKFPAPLKRLEAIACDAELQEKPLAELRKIGEMLHHRCITFLDEHTKENDNDSANNSSTVKRRGARAGFSVKFGGVSFNAKTLMACVEELQPLENIIPNSMEERQKWTLGIKTRPANFDVEWGIEEDSRLLCGIYQFGIGSWEAMKMETSLQLADKILSNDNKKPQAKHLQSRAEYLLKIIRKNVELKKGQSKQNKKQRKQKEKKVKDKVLENLDTEDISSCDELKSGNSGRAKREKNKVSESDGVAVTAVLTNDENSNGPTDKKRMKYSKDAKKAKKSKNNVPMHFTANNEPRALDVLGDLDPSIFNECKEKMRPVKKALKALDNPDQSQTNEEQLAHTRACLLNIGSQIDTCLLEYKDPDKIKEWRSNLWYFVSKFTESDAKKLFKLYKHSLKQDQKNTDDFNHVHSTTTSAGGNNSVNVPQKDAKDNNNSVNSKYHNHQANNRDHHSATGTGGDGGKDVKEKRARKDKQKQNAANSGESKNERDKYTGHEPQNDVGKDNNSMHSKRRLEEGECDFESNEYKRLHSDRSRDKEDRKKWDEYDRTARSAPRGAQLIYPDSARVPYNDGSMDRWNNSSSSSSASRDRFGDHKRERYDSYNSRHAASAVYHRERDHRDRDRDRDRRLDKRRYPMGYPNNHYMATASGSYYPPTELAYRSDRSGYPSVPGTPLDWRDYEYRREYERAQDRRQPPPPSSANNNS